MNTIQRTMPVAVARQLRLNELLPETLSSGQLTVTIIIQEPFFQVKRSWEESLEWMTGCCKDDPGTVDDFLAECHADKLRELALEKRQEAENNLYARISS
jgi:hypothetical protein